MTFWWFQIFFNLAVGGWILLAWISRRRLQEVETELAQCLHRLAEVEGSRGIPNLLGPTEPTVNLPVSALESPLGSAISTLSEKKVIGIESPGMDAYEKADLLLARGVTMSEVVRQTGLSLSELQLIRKMAQRNQ